MSDQNTYFLNLPDSPDQRRWHAYEPARRIETGKLTLCGLPVARLGIYVYESTHKALDAQPQPACRDCQAILFSRVVGWSLRADNLWTRWRKRRANKRGLRP